MNLRSCFLAFLGLLLVTSSSGMSGTSTEVESAARQRVSFDRNWRFALGHATDPERDFKPVDGFPNNFRAKTGFAVGAAGVDFDDRGWRPIDLPHDWAVELPFSNRWSGSHGFKSIGVSFPESSIGWYRKRFSIPAEDSEKRHSIEFDGVFRDSLVWVNGHLLGRVESGYTSFAYNITEYLNYGGDNIIAVRVDATQEEGWFYEGAGIYRHVWLVKTNPLHFERYGTFVTTELNADVAEVTARVRVVNDSKTNQTFSVRQEVIDENGNHVATLKDRDGVLQPGESGEYKASSTVDKPEVWSLDTPNLYKLITTVTANDIVVDQYETTFGIRSIRFDPEEGFFLNGKHVRLHGTNNHQDHAGVGAAIPDRLQEWRVARLKGIGCNAYRCSHNPPTPELLDACDRLGMLVIDENRLMGTTDYQLDNLRGMMLRDRNHPCIILWSLGNEEWRIEATSQGERILETMQDYAKRIDPTRRFTAATSGSWGQGYSIPLDVMGFNYHTHGKTDEFHQKYPEKPSLGTEESAHFSTRGVYVEDRGNCHLTAYDTNPADFGSTAQASWQYFANRKYLAGMFVWTGFDYRGEPTPFGWPAIASQFGILDLCGFYKDNAWYYQSWWTDDPVLHVFPHWNWQGREGEEIPIWVHSNCDEVELFVNEKSLGRKTMEQNSHLEWQVQYIPGVLRALGYNNGQEIAADTVETTGPATAVQLESDSTELIAGRQDISVITVRTVDAEGRMVPTSQNLISFELEGNGKIIGVGNGDPSSHEPDKYIETITLSQPDWRMKKLATDEVPDMAMEIDASTWEEAFVEHRGKRPDRARDIQALPETVVYRGSVQLSTLTDDSAATLLFDSLGDIHSVYLNGKSVIVDVHQDPEGHEVALNAAHQVEGENILTIVAIRTDPSGGPIRSLKVNAPIVKLVKPAETWQRKLFNGLAQVIVQAGDGHGPLTLTATSPELKPGKLNLSVRPLDHGLATIATDN
jgi:beta-galactosidase